MIKKIVSWKVILLLTIVFLTFTLYIFPLYGAKINISEGEFNSLDARLCYSFAQVEELFTAMGEEGRATNQFISGVIDMIYPLVYGALFVLLLIKLTSNLVYKNIKWIISLPILVVIVDYLENFSVLQLLRNFPSITIEQVALASSFTTVKFVFISMTLWAVLLLGVYHLVKKLKQG